MKKLISIMLVIAMILSLCLPAVAEESPGEAERVVTDIVLAGDSCVSVSAGVSKNNPIEGMNVYSSADYVFSTKLVGTYKIYATVAAGTGKTADITALVNDIAVGTAEFSGTAWDKFNEIYVGSVELTACEVKLRMKVGAKAALRIKSIRIVVEPANAEVVETKFLTAMKQSQTASEVQEILKEYNSSLPIPYDDYLNEIFYRKIVDEELTKLSFDSLEETDALFFTLYNEEKANPLVTVTQNGESVTKLQNGEFTVTIADRFMEELKAIAAIYSDDGLTLIDSEMIDIEPYESATITGLSATDEGKLLKLFFIKDTETLRPVELPLIQSRIYVATDGDDAGSGDIDSPLRTITKAIEKVSEVNAVHQRDTVIYLSGGEYVIDDTIELDETFSGRDDCGVHFKSLTPDNPAVISGGYVIEEEWSDTDDNGIYTAQLPDTITDVRQLYINEYPAQRARSDKYYFADNRWNNTENDIDENGKETGYTEDGFDIYNSGFPVLDKPRDAELAYPNKWTVQRLPVEDIVYEDDGRIVVKMQQPYYSTATTMICGGGVQPTIGNRFYLENDLKLLDEEGEFYFNKDSKVIYYKPFAEENLITARAVIARTENLLSIVGSSESSKAKNITFSDINFRYGGYYTKINEEGAVSFQAECLVDADSGLKQHAVESGVGRTLDAQITVENAEGIIFKNCDIACMGSTALRMGTGVSDSVVKGCIFSEVGGGALSIGTWESAKSTAGKLAEKIKIENNVVSRIGLDFMFCPAVTVYYAKDVSVLHNTIAHTPYSGISLNWGWVGEYDGSAISMPNKLGVGGHRILHNRIYDISNAVVDGGHIYNLGYMVDTLVSDNYLSDSPDSGGVYFDTGSSNVTVTHNVMTNCSVDAIFGGRGEISTGNKAYDNWSDHTQRSTTSWTAEGSSFEAPVVIEKGESWPEEAQSIMDNAGVQGDYRDNLTRASETERSTVDHFAYPSEESLEEGVIYINAGDYHRYYIKPEDIKTGKTEPALFNFSNITGVGDFRQGEWAQYEVNIPEDGEYTLTIQYSKGHEGKVTVFLSEDTPLGSEYDYLVNHYTNPNVPDIIHYLYMLPVTDTASTGYIPHVFKESDGITESILKLKEGKYYLRFFNIGNPFGFSRFKFTRVSTDK